MAGDDQQFQEKTEQATPKRLEEARKKGQVPRSKELNMAAIMISAAGVFIAMQPQIGTHLLSLLERGLTIDPAVLDDPSTMSRALSEAAVSTLSAFTPLLLAVTVAAIGGGIALGGLSFSTDPLAPKLSKLNPLKGLKRLFGLKGLVEVAKALAKAGVIGGVAFLYLSASADHVLTLGLEPIRTSMADSGELVTTTLLVCSLSLLLIALADVPYQLWNHQKELRMTRKEVTDEMKETEGRPEVRSRVRQLQQEMSDRRMLDDIPIADVIVTNPTHFAVALRYAEDDMRAPVIVAKGVDHMAARIRSIGAEHKVTQFESPLLARALYWNTEIGQEIPAQLYLAVAQVLTYVFKLKAAAENRGEWPDRPAVKVDETLAKRPERRRAKR